MSTIAAVWMLLATPVPAARWAAEVELEPIEPGEWAAWAKAQRLRVRPPARSRTGPAWSSVTRPRTTFCRGAERCVFGPERSR
jgi:hypothetical protein